GDIRLSAKTERTSSPEATPGRPVLTPPWLTEDARQKAGDGNDVGESREDVHGGGSRTLEDAANRLALECRSSPPAVGIVAERQFARFEQAQQAVPSTADRRVHGRDLESRDVSTAGSVPPRSDRTHSRLQPLVVLMVERSEGGRDHDQDRLRIHLHDRGV